MTGSEGLNVMHSVSVSLLDAIDRELEPLLAPFSHALQTHQPMVVLQFWKRTRFVPLLTAHAELRWPGRVAGLPPNPRVGLVPVTQADLAELQTPLYRLEDVDRARQRARSSSGWTPSDWEQGYYRHRAELRESELPANAFMAVDRVSPEGTVSLGHRSTLGRIAVRQAPRPSFVAPQKGGLTEKAASVFADLDTLIVNAQGVRGHRVLDTVRAVLRARGPRRSGLVVAGSPTDLLILDLPGVTRATVVPLGTPPRLQGVEVATVCRDRQLAEREFLFQVEGLRGRSKVLDGLVDMATAAWWAACQTLDGDEPEVLRFLIQLERFATDEPRDASELTGAGEVLKRAVADPSRGKERRDAVVSAVLEAKGAREILVLCRSGPSARAARSAVAAQLDVDSKELASLGVVVQTERELLPAKPPDLAIAAGYSGKHTIDQLLASRAGRLHLVLDPIEARACWYGLREEALFFLEYMGSVPRCLEEVGASVGRAMPSVGEAVTLTTVLPPERDFREPCVVSDRTPPARGEMAILFTDGTRRDVSPKSRFDVLAQAGGRLRTIAACELESGDDVVLLREDERAVFSDQLLVEIDRGPLRSLAAQRELWCTVVQAFDAAGQVKLREVTARVQGAGAPVDYSTVRSWIRGESVGDIAIPQREEHFLAFAKALGVSMNEPQLVDMFSAIRRLRVLHRKVGRDLARAIRAAYADRLDITTLARIERDWGFSARELVEAARVAEVDHVLLPEEAHGGLD